MQPIIFIFLFQSFFFRALLSNLNLPSQPQLSDVNYIHKSSFQPGVCRNLKSIVVQIGIEDYFEDPNSPEARKLFDEMVNKLQVNNTSLFHSSAPALSKPLMA